MSEKLIKVKDLTGKFSRQVEFRGYPIFTSKDEDGVYMMPKSLVDGKLSKRPFAWSIDGKEVVKEEDPQDLTVIEKLEAYTKVAKLDDLKAIFEEKYGENKADIIEGQPGAKSSYLKPLATKAGEDDAIAIEIIERLYEASKN